MRWLALTSEITPPQTRAGLVAFHVNIEEIPWFEVILSAHFEPYLFGGFDQRAAHGIVEWHDLRIGE